MGQNGVKNFHLNPLISGFWHHCSASVTEYLGFGDYNVIYPQYLDLVDSPCYLIAVVNVDYVGKCIARFIRTLDVGRRAAHGGQQVLDLHLIAFSLGAQTAAFAANHLKPDLLLDRISGEIN